MNEKEKQTPKKIAPEKTTPEKQAPEKVGRLRASYCTRTDQARPALTIIIPHYTEPLDEMDKLFTSINNQRLIKHEQIEIIVVNDCGAELSVSGLWNRYPNIKIGLARTTKNSGVGVARQRGADLASGRFIMFIDADDQLNGPHALFHILAQIHASPDADMFQFEFLEEQIVEEQYAVIPHLADEITFCHGKVYNTDFLRRNQIKCHPTLRYNEDSYFNALVYAEAEKIEHIEQPAVVWCYNEKSTVRMGGLYAYARLDCYVQSISDLIAELIKRNNPIAKAHFYSGLIYTYLQLQDEAWRLARVKPYRPQVIEAIRKFYKRHKDLDNIGRTELIQFYNESRAQFKTPIIETQTFSAFLDEIRNSKPDINKPERIIPE